MAHAHSGECPKYPHCLSCGAAKCVNDPWCPNAVCNASDEDRRPHEEDCNCARCTCRCQAHAAIEAETKARQAKYRQRMAFVADVQREVDAFLRERGWDKHVYAHVNEK